MMITKTVEVRWHYSNREYYESILDKNGKQKYIYTKEKYPFTVDMEDISEKSSSIIVVKCDYCGELDERIYRNWRVHFDISPVKKDACTKCRGKKTAESNLIVYGTANVMQLEEVKERAEETNLERYGVRNAGGSKQTQEKIKQTTLEKYGVEHYFQTEDFKAVYKETMQERYGVDNIFQTQEAKDKAKETMMERYGVEYTMQYAPFREKAVQSMYKNGSTPTSKPQIYLHQVYGGELNYPLEWYNLDIALVEDKIAIEYDGGGHDLKVILGGISEKDFKRREIIRGQYLKKNGWKLITIKSKKDNLVNEDTLLRLLEDAKIIFKRGRSWVNYCIDQQKIEYRNVEEHYDFNEIIGYKDVLKRMRF